MEKTCNSRKNLVTGYSHGWSLIIIRLSIRILQVTFFFFPQQKEGWKNRIPQHFFRWGPLHQQETKLLCQGEGSALFSTHAWPAWAAASSSGGAHTMSDCCSNECGVSVLGTAQLTTPPAALAAPQSTVKVTVSDFPISGHCCAESLPPAVYAFHT